MPNKTKYSLTELHNKSDKELAEIIRSTIIEFKRNQIIGVEGIYANVNEVNDAIFMIAIQQLDS